MYMLCITVVHARFYHKLYSSDQHTHIHTPAWSISNTHTHTLTHTRTHAHTHTLSHDSHTHRDLDVHVHKTTHFSSSLCQSPVTQLSLPLSLSLSDRNTHKIDDQTTLIRGRLVHHTGERSKQGAGRRVCLVSVCGRKRLYTQKGLETAASDRQRTWLHRAHNN